MYLEIFLADFAEFRVFWEFRGSATARNIRSPDYERVGISIVEEHGRVKGNMSFASMEES